MALTLTKITKTYSDFSIASTTNTIELTSLPAGAEIFRIKLKHSAQFGGGAITAYTLQIGYTGKIDKYLPPSDVFQTVADDTFFRSVGIPGGENHALTTSVKISATSTGANLNTATSGSVDVWVWYDIAV